MGESSGSSVCGMRNRKCYCGRRATIKISESQKNPNRLYAKCTSEKCNYFEWLGPPTQDEEKATAYQAPPARGCETPATIQELREIWHRIYMLEAAVAVMRMGFMGLSIACGVLLALLLCYILQSQPKM